MLFIGLLKKELNILFQFISKLIWIMLTIFLMTSMFYNYQKTKVSIFCIRRRQRDRNGTWKMILTLKDPSNCELIKFDLVGQ